MRFSSIRVSKAALAIALSVSMVAGLSACGKEKSDSKETTTEITQNGDVNYGLAQNIKDGAILQCFCWSFNTIKESLPDIAAAGYSTIQTSPINECYDGGNAGMELFGEGKWNYNYQPIDWKIGNYQLGSKEEFKSMCDEADKYGIKVIVDVVPNHTTKETSAVSQDFLDAVGGIDKLYHSNGKETIQNYGNRSECTLQAVSGLPDVNTENKAFQDYFISYLNDCIACGADGFRYDTAKHIGLSDDPKDDSSLENNFWDRVISEVNNADSIFNYGEVLQDGGERVADYIEKIGATTASTYGKTLRSAISSGSLDADSLTNFSVGGSNDVVTWVESHDNYTGDDSTYMTLTNEDIVLGWAAITARKYGTPLFFDRPYGATEDNMWGTMNRIGVTGDLLYKDNSVAAVNRFRNAMVGEDEKLYNANDDDSVLYIGRGTKGLTIVNAGDDTKIDAQTDLADGKYINRVDNKTEYVVSGGKITGDISGKSVVVLYNDGYSEIGEVPQVKVDDQTNMIFYDDSVEVKLIANNASKSTYSLDDGKEVEYKNEDKITVGENSKPGDIVKLTLKGQSSDGLTTEVTYEFSHKEGITEGTKIYFKKPATWGNDISCYVYDETSYSTVKTNAKWPGEKMVDEGDGLYSYTFTEEWVAPLVIFGDGKNQSNGEMEPGQKVEADKTYELN